MKISTTTSNMTKNSYRFVLCLVLFWFFLSHALAEQLFESTPTAEAPQWIIKDKQGQIKIPLYFFWSAHCPHCREARPFVETRLAQRYSWLQVYSYNLVEDFDALRRYQNMAALFADDAQSVPAFIFCGELHVGYDDKQHAGLVLEQALQACYESAQADLGKPERAMSPQKQATSLVEIPKTLPLLGEVSVGHLSLPLYTLVIAGLDAFNPCAFFVLLFLLSLLVHARSRTRMLWIGGLFVLCSGLIYFLFMVAWLNVFMLAGQWRLITLVAGGIATIFALINIKDFFYFRQGVSLSIADSAKPGLFQRMRALLGAENLFSLTLATITLAVIANSYELLCTAGFPMVYTRVLTLQALPVSQYYLYLVLYNVIYMIPLLLIVLVFTFSVSGRKLQTGEGRFLKLLSGLMMLGLGLMLLLAPEQLGHLWVPLLILGLALLLSLLLRYWTKLKIET